MRWLPCRYWATRASDTSGTGSSPLGGEGLLTLPFRTLSLADYHNIAAIAPLCEQPSRTQYNYHLQAVLYYL